MWEEIVEKLSIKLRDKSRRSRVIEMPSNQQAISAQRSRGTVPAGQPKRVTPPARVIESPAWNWAEYRPRDACVIESPRGHQGYGAARVVEMPSIRNTQMQTERIPMLCSLEFFVFLLLAAMITFVIIFYIAIRN